MKSYRRISPDPCRYPKLAEMSDGDDLDVQVKLVAPVRLGKGAYIAAGSCIVEDVPAESLALARSRQVVKHGRMRKAKKARS